MITITALLYITVSNGQQQARKSYVVLSTALVDFWFLILNTEFRHFDHIRLHELPCLEVATPTRRPLQAAAAMLLHGEVTATAWLPTCDVISARQCSYTGKSTVWHALTG